MTEERPVEDTERRGPSISPRQRPLKKPKLPTPWFWTASQINLFNPPEKKKKSTCFNITHSRYVSFLNQILIHHNYKREAFLPIFNYCLLINNYHSFYFWYILLPDLLELSQSHCFQWYKPLFLQLSHDTSNTFVPDTKKFRTKDLNQNYIETSQPILNDLPLKTKQLNFENADQYGFVAKYNVFHLCSKHLPHVPGRWCGRHTDLT